MQPATQPQVASAAYPLDKIKPSPTNPRRSYPKGPMDELIASVRTAGVIQPVVLRPWPGRPGTYELVAGSRRYKAAEAAGLKDIPARVLDLTDQQVAEVQVIENGQRTDVHPLEEAEGYQLLHSKFKVPVPELAKRVGKSREYVYGRLKLLALGQRAREAFLAGKFDASTALALARIPSDQLQAKALGEILDARWGDGGMPYRQVEQHLRSNYMLKLGDAPFDTKDAQLVPKAGACTGCPKRTGNQPELFAGVATDLCTDPTCYRGKVDAAWSATASAAAKAGQVVLADKITKRVFPYSGGSVAHDAPYVDLDAPWAQGSLAKPQPLRKVLGKHVPQVHLARDPQGNVHQLVARKDLPRALDAAGYKAQAKASAKQAGIDDTIRAEQREAQARQRLRTAVTTDLIGQVVAAAASQSTTGLGFLRTLLVMMLRGGFHEALARVVQRRGWAQPKKRPEDVLRTQANAMAKEADLRGLVLEIACTRDAYWTQASSHSDTIKAAAGQYGVDITATEKRHRKALADAQRAKAKAAKAQRPAKAPVKAKAQPPKVRRKAAGG